MGLMGPPAGGQAQAPGARLTTPDYTPAHPLRYWLWCFLGWEVWSPRIALRPAA